MLFNSVRIQGLELIEGPDRVTSRQIEEAYQPTLHRLGHRIGMLENLTGVVARRLFPIDTSIAETAALAANKALEKNRMHATDIDLLINSSVCRDYIEPSVASTVHGLLGMRPNAKNYDISNACLGFLNAMELAALMIETGEIKTALIVDAENSRQALEATVLRLQNPTTNEQQFREEFATLTLGSGAVAMILAHESVTSSPHRFVGGVGEAMTDKNDLCKGWPTQMKTDPVGLLKSGVLLGQKTFQRAREVLGWTTDSIDLAVMHQVGEAHTQRMLDSLKIDRSKAQLTYPEYGNVGPAAIPMTLKLAETEHRLKPQTRIALMGIGSGLNCAMMEIKW